MDLTAGVSNVLLSSGLLPLETEQIQSSPPPPPKENIYEELQFQPKPNPTKSKPRISMKKGISEPNLAKTRFFSARSLLDRFKRILPLSLSKQSLNDLNSMTIESDDNDETDSLSSDINDQFRRSRLDHVNRINHIYDTITNENHFMNLFSERQLTTLFDYVVHLLPEQEFGFFANGTGCLSSSNIHYPHSNSSSIRFKYPYNAHDESSLKYFCFPDQHDSNNNTNQFILSNKTKPEYFRFTLTNMHGHRQYGYCSRFMYKGYLNALCIVSPCDMMNFYERILSTATELFLSYKEDEAKIFFKEIYSHRLPSRGDMIHIHTTTVGLYTLKNEYDRRKQLIDSSTLLNLSTGSRIINLFFSKTQRFVFIYLDTIIKIFSSILYEQKVIFIGNELGSLTRLINTFITLLYPFSWPHTFIPILPPLMLDVLQAPTPYIIGILRSSESYLCGNTDFFTQDNSDILIVDIAHDRIRSITEYFYSETSRHNSFDNLNQFQILPKVFKIELKQEISSLRKNRTNLSLDECQQRLQNVFMSIFIQSCYNYQDYNFDDKFQLEKFIQSKTRTIETFLEWFTRTQMFQIFIRQKFDINHQYSFAITFDLACEKYRRTLNKHTTQQRITAKIVKRKAAIRANNRF